MSFIINNLGTILTLAVLAAIVTAIVRYITKEHAAGRTSCGCGCKNCAMCGSCHGGKKA